MLILALGVLVAPLAAQAQGVGKGVRVGVLLPIPPVYFQAFTQRLQELGYVEGQNLALYVRGAEGQFERFPGLAAELVQLHVDVIVAVAALAARSAASGPCATSTSTCSWTNAAARPGNRSNCPSAPRT